MGICQRTGKEPYDHAGAEVAVNSMRKRQPQYPVYKYRCKYCGEWHLATELKTVAQKRWHFRKCS